MATYYWVGGSGTWDNSSKTNWASSSGGAGGVGPPTSVDTVNFDANSGTSAVVSIASTAASGNTIINKSDITLSLSGNVTFSGFITLTTGTITLNDNVLTATYFGTTNTNARTINFGVGNISLTASGLTVWSCNTGSGFSVTGTPLVKLTSTASSGTRGVSHGNSSGVTESNAISFSVTGGTDTVSFAGRGINVDFTGFAGTFTCGDFTCYGNVIFPAGITTTSNSNVLIFAPSSGTKTVNIKSTLNFPIAVWSTNNAVVQLQANVTTNSTSSFQLLSGVLDLTGNSGNWTLTAGTFSGSNSSVRSIVFGTGNITLIGSGTVWNTGTVTNFSYTGTPTINISNNSATASTVTTGAMSAAQALNFNYTVGTYALTDTSSVYKSLSFSGFAGTVPNSVRTIYGNLTLGSGATYTAGSNATTFAATSGTNTITTNGVTADFPLTFNGVGGTWQLQDNLTVGSSRTVTLTNGTLNANGKNVTIGAFALGSGTKTLTLGSGTWTVAGASWDANTNVTGLTVSASTGTISMTSGSAKTFSGGGLTWPTLNQGGAGALTIAQSNTFANITDTVQPATVRLTAGTTQTVSALSLAGTSGNLITLDTTVAGTKATIYKASGSVSLSFVSIKDISATGGANFNAFTSNGCVDGGNNTGWDFNSVLYPTIYTVRKTKRYFLN